jgi:hypothetical protein
VGHRGCRDSHFSHSEFPLLAKEARSGALSISQTPKIKIPTLSRKAREGWGTRSQEFHGAVPTGIGKSCPPVQKVGGGGLRGEAGTSTIKMFSFRPRSRVGLRASQSEAAPYGSDKRKIDTEFKGSKVSFANSSSFSRLGVRFIACPVSVSSRNPQLRGTEGARRA